MNGTNPIKKYLNEKSSLSKLNEEFCKMISGKSDIFYGTNKEILLAK